MTGLDLESFLHLLRADLGAWSTLGLIVFLLAVMTWTSWGSRRALRKCLVLSIAAHVGIVVYGSTHPFVLLALQSRDSRELNRERIREIKVAPLPEESDPTNPRGPVNRSGQKAAPWEPQQDSLALADAKLATPRPDLVPRELGAAPSAEIAPLEAAAPDVNPPVSTAPEPPPGEAQEGLNPPPAEATPSDPSEIAAPVLARPKPAEPETSPLDQIRSPRRPGRSPRPGASSLVGRSGGGLPELLPPASSPPAENSEPVVASETVDIRPQTGGISTDESATKGDMEDPAAAGVAGRVIKRPTLEPAVPDVLTTDVRGRSRPKRAQTAPNADAAEKKAKDLAALALSRTSPGALPRLPETQGNIGPRPLSDVPEVYRSRLDPNRSTLAQRAGASTASEQSVERALDWLARHQDADGRWDGGVARDPEGGPIKGDDDFTVHCPPGEPCVGECLYWEADTALTGLALLAFLGSGYTHTDGKYSETVGKGLDFLRQVQRPDGDLRGQSKAVGMYCHAMASLALCEAYALTGDERLRNSVEKAVGFLIRSRAVDGQSWRYAPGARAGDTSILGWVVMVMKSAKVVGIPIPPSIQGGTLTWLGRVASGPDRGLAAYQPNDPPTPTMTAEAWVCRQFLGVGGPSRASTEAAEELLANGPGRAGSDAYNLYYWYYGTLAMYQYGGSAWSRWNVQVRDQLVRRQRTNGHRTGSWDPDETVYGSRGGRIYSTALATLTLEVYYRFLRLYNDPDLTPLAPGRPTRRFSNVPPRSRS